MATSGTYDFNMDIDEVIQEAMEMIGGEETLGHEPKSARRSINLLLQDWQNRGVMLWTANTSTVDLTTSVTTFALDSSTIDVLEAVHNREDRDIQLERISMQEYLKIPNKGQTGRTTQYAVRHERGNPVVNLWPIPENSTDKIKLELVSYMEDVNKSAIQNADISRRFLPCLTAGLAYYMSMKRPGVEAGRISMIKQEYEERLQRAMDEDRERVSIFLKPRVMV
jgi:hypothetical protein|tara:strand:+ start:927 stop:1598 length:672 start_codon:yes stop_codon:yes gene_type:complete